MCTILHDHVASTESEPEIWGQTDTLVFLSQNSMHKNAFVKPQD